jgi:hypothetical protein
MSVAVAVAAVMEQQAERQATRQAVTAAMSEHLTAPTHHQRSMVQAVVAVAHRAVAQATVQMALF